MLDRRVLFAYSSRRNLVTEILIRHTIHSPGGRMMGRGGVGVRVATPVWQLKRTGPVKCRLERSCLLQLLRVPIQFTHVSASPATESLCLAGANPPGWSVRPPNDATPLEPKKMAMRQYAAATAASSSFRARPRARPSCLPAAALPLAPCCGVAWSRASYRRASVRDMGAASSSSSSSSSSSPSPQGQAQAQAQGAVWCFTF